MTFTGLGFEGTLQEAQFAQMLGAMADHGVAGEYNGTDLAAAKVVGARSLRAQPGEVLVPGVLGVLDTATTSDVATSLSGTLPRIDLLIAKFDWAGAGSVTLEMKEGSPNASPKPPTVQQDPGVIFEVPIAQARLLPGDGEYAAADVVDRRYWIEAGKYVLPQATQLPPARAGAIAVRPDTKQMVIHNGSAWDTYKAESDTGMVAIAGPYPGFTGSTWGQIKNGVAFVTFPWTKNSTGMTNQDISLILPSDYIPNFDWTFELFAGSPKAPILLTMSKGSHVIKMDNVTLNGGGALRGTISYPV